MDGDELFLAGCTVSRVNVPGLFPQHNQLNILEKFKDIELSEMYNMFQM